MIKLFLVGMGGFIGSILRYLLSGFAQSAVGSFQFPFGTLFVNVSGCLFIGCLSQLAEDHGFFSSHSRLFLFVGVLGGFTTFSAFSAEAMNLLRDREQLLALAYVMGHVILGLGAVWAGRALVHLVWR